MSERSWVIFHTILPSRLQVGNIEQLSASGGMSNYIALVEQPNEHLQDQYIKLRQRAYLLHYPKLAPSFGVRELDDELGQLVVAVDEGLVVGGARLNWSNRTNQRRLPLETDSFRLPMIVPEYCQDTYAEISRYVVAPEVSGGGAIGLEIAKAMCERAAALGVHTLFSMCPPVVARLNRRNAKICGVGYIHFSDISVPNPFGLDLTLCAYTGVSNQARKAA